MAEQKKAIKELRKSKVVPDHIWRKLRRRG